MNELILTNANLVLETEVVRGTLIMKDGHITTVDVGPTQVAGAVDCDGDILIPGLVELHTDNLERHMQPRPKVDWPHASAILAHDGELASVGITTVFDAMRVGSVTSNNSAEYKPYARPLSRELLELRAKGLLRISHFLHLRAEVCSESLIAELDEFDAEDRVRLVSLMDHTPGQRQFRDVSKFKDYICGKKGLSDAGFEEHVARLTALHARLGAAHEAAAVAAAKRFSAVLASHDDTTKEHVLASAAHGIRLAEFPTTVEAAEACRAQGIAVIMGAPNVIRGGSHSGNVSASELARRGLLDILSSDYVPSSLMSAAFRLADLWDDLPRAIATVTANPAAATGLADRGTLSEGLFADVVRVSRDGATPVVRGVWAHGRQVG